MERRAELVLCECTAIFILYFRLTITSHYITNAKSKSKLLKAAKMGGRAFATARTLSAQRGRLNVLFVANLCRLYGDRSREEAGAASEAAIDGPIERVAELCARPSNGGATPLQLQLQSNDLETVK